MYWIVKQEPEAYSWADFVRDGGTVWTGVRNYQARNNLRAMRHGHRALFYHSVTEKAIVGEATVTREAYPDPTATDGDWSAVDLAPLDPFPTPVTLQTIKTDETLRHIALIRQSRLSVVPLTEPEYHRLRHLAGLPTP